MINKHIARHLNHKLLDREKERELIKQYKQGNKKACEILVKHNYKFVVKTALKYKQYCNDKILFDDIVQEGCMGLVKGIEKFDLNNNNRLITYSIWWMKARINIFIQNNYRTFRLGTTNMGRKLFPHYFLISSIDCLPEYKKDEERKDIAKRLNISVSDIRDMESLIHYSSNISLNNHRTKGNSDIKMIDLVAISSKDACEQANAKRARHALGKAMLMLNDREQKVVRKKIDNMNNNEIGAEFGVSGERIRQINKAANKKIRAALQKMGINSMSEII